MAMATALSVLVRVVLVMYTTAKCCCAPSSVEGEEVVAGTFSFASLPLPPELTTLGDATSDGKIWLTPDLGSQQIYEMQRKTGRLVCATPLASLIGGDNNTTNVSLAEIVSLQSTFEFQFITPPVSSGTGGDGLAFFISPQGLSIPANSTGGALGIADYYTADVPDPSLHLFAIEFDTFQNANFQDPNNNHVGIDINSVISNVAVDTNSTALDLYSNSTFRVWLDYYSANHSVELRMLKVGGGDSSSTVLWPLHPLLNMTYDLSTLILHSGSDMFVGLSGTTYDNYQGCAIPSWNFTLTALQQSALSPPIAPALSSMKVSTTNVLPKLIPGTVAGAIVATVGAVAVAIVAYRKRWCCSAHGALADGHDDDDDSVPELGIAELALIPQDALVPAAMPRYTFGQLSKATQGFHDKAKVGYGGFSTVYKGKLIMPAPSNYNCRDIARPMQHLEVAVKRLNKEGLRKIDEFFTEIKVIHSLRHPRLVELKGWCYEGGEAMLVYEFMGNGSLADQLFRGSTGKKKKGDRSNLSSEVRVGIVKGAAEALAHLHAAGAVHRDVKAANVLLTTDMEAKLGDFGLLRLLKDEQQMTQMMTAAGTPGYAAPELLFTRTPTDKANVYSFGVLMLEVACGRRAIDVGLMEEHDRHVLLLDWVWSKHERGELMSVLDPTMFNGERIEAVDGEEEEEEGGTGIWRCVLHLALRCCHPIPNERPSMKDVLDGLESNILVSLDKSRPMYRVGPGFLPWVGLSAESTSTSNSTGLSTGLSSSSTS